ncbi:MAG: GNAT family N-acetyltransferase [Alphaproteobacteria bacterium]|nr:GNAT family N-acetyltransferase [Alphaproteobacteria bacterium]
MPLLLRDARPDEAPALSDLAMRAKAFWGYDDAFMEACRAELTLRPADIDAKPVVVAEADGALLGFYALGRVDDATTELDDLFVEPGAIGQGVGRRLMAHAVEAARRAGYARLRIEADPFAEGFYQRMGARRVGEAPSQSIPGRMLPLLLLDL